VTTPRNILSPGAPPALRLPRAPTLRSRSARGDAAAFAALYQRHHQELYRYCRAILRHDEDAQDALQSAMAKAYAALQHETRDFEVRPWLFRIAHNEAISVLRRRRQATNLDSAPEIAVDSLPGTLADRERLSDLRADLADLPERQRAALVLREMSGLGHEEIAQVLSSSARAVKQSIFEARTGLAECAEGREMRCETVQRVLSDADGRVLRGRRIRAHLRSCRTCRQFGAAMRTRPADLRALAAPLPAGAGAAVLAAVLPGGSATVAGGAGTAAAGGAFAAGAAGAAGAGPATAGGVLAGAESAAVGGAFAGLATKAAIVATIGAAAVGATKLDGSRGGSPPAERAPIVRATQAPTAPASLGAASVARRSGAPAAGIAGPAGAAAPAASPGRSRPGRAKHAPHTRRHSTAARSGDGPAATAGGHDSTHAPRPARRVLAARPGHAARPAHAPGPAHAAQPARAARPAPPVRRPRSKPSRPVAPASTHRPAARTAPVHRASPSRRSKPAARAPGPAPTPAPANPGHGGSQPAAGRAK